MESFSVPQGEQVGQRLILLWPKHVPFVRLLEKVAASQRFNILKSTADSDESHVLHA